VPLAIERLAGPGLLGRILPLQSFADDIQGPADEPSVVRALGTWCVGRKYGEIRLLMGKLLQTIGLFGAYVFRRAICAASFRSRSYCLRRFESFGRKERVQVQDCAIEQITPQNEDLSYAWKSGVGR